MNKYIFIIALLVLFPNTSLASQSLIEHLTGRILLQVENKGEAWFVHPSNLKKYYLGRPADAYNIMKYFGIGITNYDLERIPIGLIDGLDSDGDGLSDDLEQAIETNPQEIDSDGDGYIDGDEVNNNYSPNNKDKYNIDTNFSQVNAGRIFLQTQKNGQAWYINPADAKRYYLGKPTDAFKIMQKLGLGVRNNDLDKIISDTINLPAEELQPSEKTIETIKEKRERLGMQNTDLQPNNQTNNTAIKVLHNTASAIRRTDKKSVSQYFSPELKKAIDYTMDFLDDDGILAFSNIFSALKFEKQDDNKKIYSTEIYFGLGGYNIDYSVVLEKQEDGDWLIISL